MGCAQGKPKPPKPENQPSKPLQSNPSGNASLQGQQQNVVNSSITDKNTNNNQVKEVNGYGTQGFGAQGSGVQGSGIQGAGSGIKQSGFGKPSSGEINGGQTVEYRANGDSWGNNDVVQSKQGKANNVPASGFKPTNSEYNPAGSALNSVKNSQLNPIYGSPGKNQSFNHAALPSQTKNQFSSSNFQNNDSINKKGSQLSKNSNYESAKKSYRDDDGFVPEDSIMDYGQSTITDPSKIEVHFHI